MTKRFLGILVLGLLLGALTSCDDGKIDCRFHGNCTSLEKLKNNITDLNPIDYIEKRKKCKDGADRQDTVAQGKRYYKNCMEY